MNHNADQRRIDNDSGKKKSQDGFRRQKARPVFVLGWIAVGITCIVLVILFFFPRLDTPIARLSNLKSGSKVFRTKIPEEIKNEANLYRGKIPVVDQPLKPALPPQPIIALPEQGESKKETDLHMPIEPKIANETKPLVANALPSQPDVVLTEKSEPPQEVEPYRPVKSPTINEIKPSVANTLPSQPDVAPAEKIELPQEVELHQPIQSPIINETESSVANTLPSQPDVAPAEKIEPPQEVEPYRPVKSPTINEIKPSVVNALPSQLTVTPAEKGEPPQAEVRLQPVKEVFKEKTDERIIQNETWLLSQKASHYTIQIMGVRKEELLFDFVERNQLLEQNEIAFYQTTFKDKPWFQLLQGVYPTKKDAQTAADALPSKIRKSAPWIRRLSGVQKTIRKHTAR